MLTLFRDIGDSSYKKAYNCDDGFGCLEDGDFEADDAHCRDDTDYEDGVQVII